MRYNLFKKSGPAFIHIPKTGGTYVSQQESSGDPVVADLLDLGHSVLYEDKKPSESFPPKGSFRQKSLAKNLKYINADLFFTNVRNPFEWLVSYWFHAGGKNKKYCDKNHYDFDIAQKGFPYFVRQIAKREGARYWPSKRFLFFQAFEYNGHFLPDWVNRTKFLDKDLFRMAREFGLEYKKKEKQRVGRKDRGYKKYYDNNLRKLVEKTWSRELRLFGFGFDGYNPDRAIVKNIVSKRLKNLLVYKWNEDKLLLGKSEIH